MDTFNVWTMVVTPIALAVLGSGAMQVIASTFLARRRLKVEEEFEDRRREKQSAAALDDRRAQAHETARQEHSDRVARIYRLLDEISWKALGPEVGAWDPEPSARADARSKAGEAIRLLREVWTAHPTESVRRMAKELSERLVGFYAEPPPDVRGWPSYRDSDELLDHQARAEALIEELHRPPRPVDQTVYPARRVRTRSPR